MLHSMTIRLIHVHQLETLYLYHGVKYQPGVIWGHRGQKVIFSKMLLLLQNTWYYQLCNKVYPRYSYVRINLRLSIVFIGSRTQGQIKVTSAGRIRHLWWQMSLVSSFFLLATLLGLIAPTCLDWFQPNLVIRTPDPWHLCHMTRVGSKVT